MLVLDDTAHDDPLGIRIIGTLVSDRNPPYDVPRLARLYREGKLKVEERRPADFQCNRELPVGPAAGRP